MKKLISVTLAACLLQQSVAFAQLTPTNMSIATAREYFIGRDMGKPLVTVQLLNGVTLPGVYHIPIDTDIAELIAYAGGATERADLEEITVRHGKRGQYSITNLDLEKALRDPSDLLKLQDQDTIQIHQKMSLDRPVAYATILSAIASVVLTAVLIHRGN